MKVSITKESKKILTLDEASAARKMILDLKEDPCLTDYAEMAVAFASRTNHSNDCCKKILEVSARIAKNCTVWNYYHDDSRDLDVWVEITARTNNGCFYMIGAYLSDIWTIGPEDQDREIASRMYIRKFVEV